MAATEQGRRIGDKPALPPTDALIKQFGNKSRAIRSLSADGYTRSQIANALGIRYQHVRNVLQTPVKKVSGSVSPEGETGTETRTETESGAEDTKKEAGVGASKKRH